MAKWPLLESAGGRVVAFFEAPTDAERRRRSRFRSRRGGLFLDFFVFVFVLLVFFGRVFFFLGGGVVFPVWDSKGLSKKGLKVERELLFCLTWPLGLGVGVRWVGG